MNSLTLSSALIAVTSLSASIIIPFFGQKKIQLLWAWFNLLVAIWAMGLVLTSVSRTPEQASLWLKLLQVAGGLTPMAYCHFVYEFAGINSPRTVRISYIIGVIVCIFVATGIVHTNTELVRNSFYYVRSYDWTYYIVTVTFLVYTVWGGLTLWNSFNSSQGEKRIQAKILVISTFIGFATGTASHFFTVHNIFDYPEINIFVPIYTLLPTYAIFRHKLFGIDVVIRRSFVYSIIIFIVTAIYFLTVYFIGSAFGKLTQINSFPVILFVLTMITLLFRPIERRVQKAIDRIFYKRPVEELSAENFLMRSQLQDRDRMKSVATLAAGMAHEIKNPLTTIKTFAEYLPKKYDDPEFRSRFSRLIVEEVDRINHIVQQLLEFSKPSKLSLRPILASTLMSETIDLMTNELLKRKIILQKELDPYAMVLVDKNQIKQALLNIFLNSIQAMGSSGKLIVIVRRESDGLVRLSVADSGAGIPKDKLDHVFDPFYTTKEQGTGLGLSIVHSIIRNHGGKITISSTIGIGTTVNVFLKSQN